MNKPPRFLIITVLYKTKWSLSKTIASLQKSRAYLSNSKLLLWDNSPELQAADPQHLQFVDDFEYKHTPQNIALSKIYNRVISTHDDFDYLLILDQDSSFEPMFFAELLKTIKAYPDISLFLPLVLSNDTIISPGSYKYIKGKYWTKRTTGVLRSKSLLAINSGMVIKFDYLKDLFPGYDERLKLYGIDTHFMLTYAQHKTELCVIDYTFKHESALLDPSEGTKKRLFRFQDKIYSWKILHEKNFFKSLLIRLYILGASIKESSKSHDIRFLLIGIGILRIKNTL